MKRLFAFLVLTVFVLVWSGNTQAAAPDLLAKAKMEGKVMFYSSFPVWVNKKLTDAFTKKYGIKAESYRAGSLKLLQKFYGEAKAGKQFADVLHQTYLPGFWDMKKKGMIAKYESPERRFYPAQFKDSEGFYTVVRLVAVFITYNPRKISAAEAPKRWEDLLDPKWKGQLVSADFTYGGFQLGTYHFWEKKLGLDFIRKLSKQNVMMVKSNGAAIRQLMSGEKPLMVMSWSYDSWYKRKKGRPVEIVIPKGKIPWGAGYVAITAKAPHPNAARLFENFLLSAEGQAVVQSAGAYSARRGMPPIPGLPKLKDMDLVEMDWKDISKQSKALQKKYRRAMRGQ